MAGLDLITAAAAEPIILADAKDYLNIQDSDDDSKIEDYISAARSNAEAFLKMSLMETTWKYRIDLYFPREIRAVVFTDFMIASLRSGGVSRMFPPTSYSQPW